ncbi:hypothetical protein C8Q72DRAFT_56315 [Fomitopsis betulina]|nr:hypothetical protein C8Q72DRAFT_56315 [Fomitopsis betulina]
MPPRHAGRELGRIRKRASARRTRRRARSARRRKTRMGPSLRSALPRQRKVSSQTSLNSVGGRNHASDDVRLSAEDIALMPVEERSKVAAALKARGNAAYSSRQFSTAIDLYTRAIEVTPKPEPVFYSNRAACYINLSPPDHEKVVADCDAALALDSSYVKALNRRATALESLDRNEEALRDYTAATILNKFQNEAAAQSVERVLKKLAGYKSQAILAGREQRLPSHTFVSAYFGAFRPRQPPTLPESPSQGDQTLVLAFEALSAGDHTHALSLVNEAIEQGISFDAGKAEALNLRGTFKYV